MTEYHINSENYIRIAVEICSTRRKTENSTVE